MDGNPVNPVWPVPVDRPVGILVGESPGSDEVKTGRPFSGPTGKQLDFELLEAGLDRSKLFILNAVLCNPGDGKIQRRMKTVVDCCSGVFKALIAGLEKLPTLTMGSWAALAWSGKNVNLEKGRGFIRDL